MIMKCFMYGFLHVMRMRGMKFLKLVLKIFNLMLHLILYEVPHCDFHHIDGDLLLVPWSFWIDLGGYIFIELLFSLDHLEVFGLGESHFSLVGWLCLLVWWSSHMCLPC
jgi:hypothetical protein